MRNRAKRLARRRQAPKVRRCACGGNTSARSDHESGLLIGGARDPAEARADARAAGALASAPPIRRKCAACADEEKAEARRSAPAPALAPGSAAAPAPKAAKAAIDCFGPGRSLSSRERGYFEPRLGADFSRVRLHEDASADAAARAMDAAAFTLGRDIAFARGESARVDLLAHELAHVAEDGQADCDARRAIRRRIQVHAPNDKIPKPGGKGLDQTNAETVQTYLDQICPFGTPEVSASTGNAGMGDMECIFPDQLGVGCGCICELDEAPVTVTIHVRDEGMKIKGADSTSPHTTATGFGAETGQGTGSDVIVPSPNDTVEYGYADVTGAKQAFSNCEILGHELCGHARLNARGTHPRDQLNKEVRHGHETVVPMENAIRNERGITNRDRGAGAADPYCGESFKRKKGAATFEDKDAKHLAACRHLRIFYLERLKWARKKLPPDEQVKLTPLKKTYDVSERLPEK